MEILARMLSQNKLTEFLVGEGEFYKESPGEYFGDQPNFYTYWWRNEIEPFLNSENRERLSRELIQSFLILTNYSKDINLGIYTLLSHLVQYCYSLNADKTIFIKLNIDEIVPSLKQAISANRQNLIQDKRWAGKDINGFDSPLGLWGAVTDFCKQINRFGGPSLIPDEE